MLSPSLSPHSLEGSSQLFNGSLSEDRGLETGSGMEVCARNGHEHVPALDDLDLAVADVVGEPSDASEFERSPVKRVAGISYGDLALTFVGDEWGITLGGVFPRPWVR